MKIYMVETNGLPNLSEGNTPEIHSLEYGCWATEVLNGLNIETAYVAGASFGGLICMKLGLLSPERIKAAFLLNPGCLQPFSLRLKNLYYNLLPILRPNETNVLTFLEQAVFCKPNHQLSPTAEKMLVDYEVFALTRYKDNTQKPYYMDRQLAQFTVDTFLLEGDQDLLFPHQKSIDNARKHMKSLKQVVVFPKVGHGIETYDKALNFIGKTIQKS
ncbi:alpha/beta fold hydrolase [Salmonirosea aquatica]